MTADQIAKGSRLFSFGTNDLTQMTFDSAAMTRIFPPFYTDKEILADNPTETIDQEGVGQLMRIAVTFKAAPTNTLKLVFVGNMEENLGVLPFATNSARLCEL